MNNNNINNMNNQDNIARESYMKLIVSDFDKFIQFIEETRPYLSPGKLVLGKKDCFKLNAILTTQRDVSKANYNQDQYPMIDLLFSLALDSGLYIRYQTEKGPTILTKTPLLNDYENLNMAEKYVFLLQTYWTKYDFEGKFENMTYGYYYISLINDIAKATAGDKIMARETFGRRTLFLYYVNLLHNLQYFGICSLELIPYSKSRNKPIVHTLTPNEFGKEVAHFLINEAVEQLNFKDIGDIEDIEDYIGIKTTKKKTENVFDIFKNIFPGEDIKETVRAKPKDKATDNSGVYTFKVCLSKSKKIWRKISISHLHTLEDLHLAIIEAFSFDNDHLYAFFPKITTRNPIFCPEADNNEGPTTAEVTIEQLGLHQGQKIYYLYDFGDRWKFELLITNIVKDAPVPLKAEVTEKKGISPKQYYG